MELNDIVSDNDPYSEIFDLVVAVPLQSFVWIDENGRCGNLRRPGAGRLPFLEISRIRHGRILFYV